MHGHTSSNVRPRLDLFSFFVVVYRQRADQDHDAGSVERADLFAAAYVRVSELLLPPEDGVDRAFRRPRDTDGVHRYIRRQLTRFQL